MATEGLIIMDRTCNRYCVGIRDIPQAIISGTRNHRCGRLSLASNRSYSLDHKRPTNFPRSRGCIRFDTGQAFRSSENQDYIYRVQFTARPDRSCLRSWRTNIKACRVTELWPCNKQTVSQEYKWIEN